MKRTTNEMLNSRLEQLNRIMKTTEGNRYRIGGAYGGVRLEQDVEDGGVNGLTPYESKKEVLAFMDAFIMGALAILNK